VFFEGEFRVRMDFPAKRDYPVFEGSDLI